jgi:hypothetical protein
MCHQRNRNWAIEEVPIDLCSSDEIGEDPTRASIPTRPMYWLAAPTTCAHVDWRPRRADDATSGRYGRGWNQPTTARCYHRRRRSEQQQQRWHQNTLSATASFPIALSLSLSLSLICRALRGTCAACLNIWCTRWPQNCSARRQDSIHKPKPLQRRGVHLN